MFFSLRGRREQHVVAFPDNLGPARAVKCDKCGRAILELVHGNGDVGSQDGFARVYKSRRDCHRSAIRSPSFPAPSQEDTALLSSPIAMKVLACFVLAVLLVAVSATEEPKKEVKVPVVSATLGYPGWGYPGLGYHGLGYSGLGYGYPGLGYHGLGYSGLGYGYPYGYHW